jgi:hypothetical protein
MQEELIEETGKMGFLSWIKSIFGGGKDEIEEEPQPPHYKRKLLDGRIEKYLDQNLSTYITEYGILTGLDLESYEIRYDKITGRISTMKEYMLTSDARITEMERDIAAIQKSVKGGK